MVFGESLYKKERESIRLTILAGRAVLCSPSLNFNMPWWHLRVIIMETNVCVRACILVRVFIYSGQSACEVCICWSVWSFHSWPRNTSGFVHTNALIVHGRLSECFRPDFRPTNFGHILLFYEHVCGNTSFLQTFHDHPSSHKVWAYQAPDLITLFHSLWTRLFYTSFDLWPCCCFDPNFSLLNSLHLYYSEVAMDSKTV